MSSKQQSAKQLSAKQRSAKKAAVKKQSGRTEKRHYLRAEERRSKILEAARKVFARVGLKGARTRELAQAAGINQATLFEHFSSKESLFVAAVVDPLEELLEGSRNRAEAYAQADSAEILLSEIEIGMQQHLQNMIDIFPLLAQALFSDQELGEKLYREHVAPLLQARADLMEPYIKNAIDPKLVQLASFGMVFALAMDQQMTGQQHDLDNIAHQLTEIICFGATRR